MIARLTAILLLATGLATGCSNLDSPPPGPRSSKLDTEASKAAGRATGAPVRPTIPGDGTFRVPQDAKPGTYRSAGPDESKLGCYWARLDNTSGDTSAILANNLVQGPTTVTIKTTDKAFETSGCQTWARVN